MTSSIDRAAGEHYCVFDTAIGPCGIAWNAHGLTRLNLPERDRAATERRLGRRGAAASDDPPAAVRSVIAQVQRYCAGEPIDFAAVVLDMTHIGAFERSVYAAARDVSFGHTVTYGELARRIGTPRATREVGQALSQNPFPIIVPCHRILAKEGMGGFSAHGGASTKERLLELEGVRHEKQLPLAFMSAPRGR